LLKFSWHPDGTYIAIPGAKGSFFKKKSIDQENKKKRKIIKK